MPVVNFNAGESKGWQPLPKGTYQFQITSADPTKVSSNNNPQMMCGLVVVGGDHDGKKASLWSSLVAKAGWKVKELLDATGIPYEETGTDEVDDEGKPLKGYSFDSDDLIGASFLADVTIRENKQTGKENNDFDKLRPVEEATPAAKPATAAAAPRAAAPAPAATAAPAQGAATRRPRA